MAKLKPQARLAGKVIGMVAIVSLGLFGAYKAGLLDDNASRASLSTVPEDVQLTASQDHIAAQAMAGHTRTFTVPSNTPVSSGTPIRYLGFAWNSQMGLAFANGGPVTTQGSLMAERGLKVTFTRQDDTSLMQADLVACARELAQGSQDCQSGSHFMAVMGDGTPAILRGLNEALKQLPGSDLRAEIVASTGYSRGEDKFMGPVAWRDNPESAKGSLIAGVLRDGDWNLAMDWANKNDICNNPDPTTFDRECLNWMATSDYLTPVEKYNQGACEERPVVRNGRPTGDRARICVGGVVTWTPGDVNVARGKGGLVSLLDTSMNATQMFNAVIGIRRWNRAHRDAVVKFVEAVALGSQAVNQALPPTNHPEFLLTASRISNTIYNEEGTGPMYWAEMWRGKSEMDSTGLQVQLGGSKANNIADMQALFGLLPGTTNSAAASYTTFGNIMRQQYPNDMPDYPAFAEVSDTSYIQAAAQNLARSNAPQAQAEVPTFATTAPNDTNSRVVARRNWTINFRTGSADFTPETEQVLEELKSQLIVSSNLYVDLHGHTDATGNADFNRDLSQRRAQAVADWLRRQSEVSFPTARMHVYGHGSDVPLVPGSNAAANAQNRRVTIELRAQQS